MSFSRPLTVTQIGAGLWKTAAQFTFKKVRVPKGFITDFASIPWPVSMFFPKSGRYNQAAVLHDYLYYIQDRPRKEADDLFLEGMKILGVPAVKRHLFYRAVRLFGWVCYKKRNCATVNVEK